MKHDFEIFLFEHQTIHPNESAGFPRKFEVYLIRNLGRCAVMLTYWLISVIRLVISTLQIKNKKTLQIKW